MGEELPNSADVDDPLVHGRAEPKAATAACPPEGGGAAATADQWLLRARKLLPTAMQRARDAKGYPPRWKAVVSRLERVPACLSDLSSHPVFSRNALCLEQLQCVCHTLLEASELADRCADEDTLKHLGKLQMQSDLDAVIGRLDMNLRDCGLLVKTGVLGSSSSSAGPSRAEQEGVRELLTRLQIGEVEARHRAVDGLLELMKEDEKSVLGALGRGNLSALIQLLSAPPAKVREKAANAICQLVESGNCQGLLVSEGVLPPLIRLAESGSPASMDKAVASLQRLSTSPETARSIAGHGGIRPLIEVCTVGDDPVSQAAAAGALKNLSLVPEIRHDLAEEGAVKVAIDLLDRGLAPASKEYAAQCLQNLTASNESLRRAVVVEGGVWGLLSYVDGPAPHEPAVAALRNLVGCVPAEGLVRMRLLPRLARVLKVGSTGAQQAAASVICKISNCSEMKKLVGESGCVPLLVRTLESKSSNAREAAAQAIASLVSHQQNARELRKDDKGAVPNLVQLLDPSPLNTAKKYAVTCLLALSSSRKCRRSMISHGAIGYLKKLGKMEVPGARKLLERLDRGRLPSLFGRK